MAKYSKYQFSREKTLKTIQRILNEHIEENIIWKSSDIGSDRMVFFQEKTYYNFGSCSYLGLHLRPELTEGTIAAVRKYGTQFSYSRVYLSCDLYLQLENFLGEITGRHALVGASTSLVHLAALPVLIHDDDIVIIDQFAHSSLYTAVELLGSTPVIRVRHSSMDQLESLILESMPKHKNIWYICDGLYSMRGDFAPFEILKELLQRYPQLHLYIDDAHSTSWYGKNGCGAAITHLPNDERVVVILSLNKAFSAAGGAMIVSNAQLKHQVRCCGGTMNFSGPIQPPMLGAAVASARLHLKPEFSELQDDLHKKITFTHNLAEQMGVNIIAQDLTPIFMLPYDTHKQSCLATKEFLNSGFYVCMVAFPAVPLNKPGIRFTISATNDFLDIKALLNKAKKVNCHLD